MICSSSFFRVYGLAVMGALLCAVGARLVATQHDMIDASAVLMLAAVLMAIAWKLRQAPRSGAVTEALDGIDQAIVVLDAKARITFVNEGFRHIFALDGQSCRCGTSFAEVLTTLAERHEFGNAGAETVIAERLAPFDLREPARLTRTRPDGQRLEEIGTPLPGGGYSFNFADVTAQHLLKNANRATVMALADLAEFRDTDTGDHVIRVARLTHEITRTLDDSHVLSAEITPDFRAQIGVASILHDVGKVAIADSILHKAGLFDDAERRQMQEHATAGAGILGKALALAPDSTYLRMAAEIARHHHERYDGAGYPDGLSGEAIPLAARIVAVADVFDALTSDRPYKQPWPEEKTVAYLTEQSGKQFDPTVITAVLSVLAERRQTPVIAWTEAMSVGNPVLDRDHRTLIGLVNQMNLPANRDDHAVQQFVLDELLDYTVAHFAREEEYLLQIGFPERPRHQAIHRNLTGQLVSLRANFASGKQDIGEEVCTFLADWLRNHILLEDFKYVESVKASLQPATSP